MLIVDLTPQLQQQPDLLISHTSWQITGCVPCPPYPAEAQPFPLASSAVVTTGFSDEQSCNRPASRWPRRLVNPVAEHGRRRMAPRKTSCFRRADVTNGTVVLTHDLTVEFDLASPPN